MSKPTPEQARRATEAWRSVLAELYPGLVFDITVGPGRRSEPPTPLAHKPPISPGPKTGDPQEETANGTQNARPRSKANNQSENDDDPTASD